MARSLADIKKTHGPKDSVVAMKAAIAGIPKGQYETSSEVCARANLSTRIIPHVQPKLAEYAVLVKNGYARPAWLWARTPADAKKLRDGLKSQNG